MSSSARALPLMPDPCSESVPPRGGEGLLRRLRRPAGEHMGWVGFGPPVVPKGVRSVWDPETFTPGHKSRAEARPTGSTVSEERLGDWDGPMAV